MRVAKVMGRCKGGGAGVTVIRKSYSPHGNVKSIRKMKLVFIDGDVRFGGGIGEV